LVDRLALLEDHLAQLERAYPPWAALHFRQPRRGVRLVACDRVGCADLRRQWPPAPRATPILVDARTTALDDTAAAAGAPEGAAGSHDAAARTGPDSKGKGKGKGRKATSLHRAIMEKLEVQKVKEELAEHAL
jgi:hypothetical protein